MDDPFLPGVHARIRQAFLLSLARQPLTLPPSFAGLVPSSRDPALALLALTGQHQRFAGPLPPALEPIPQAAQRLHEDPRPILPPLARRAMTRLATSVEKAFASSVLSIAVRRVAAVGCRVHPFDLPDLARHIKADTDSLGLAERSYLALTAIESDDVGAGSLFFERITADNWQTFPKAHRRAFVAALRKDDAAAGRALVEGVWKTEPAPVRAALLEALAVALGPDDKAFLDQLATDRAETVKRTAAQLLARMPSTASFEARLFAAAQCFSRPRPGILATAMNAMGHGEAGLRFTPPVTTTALAGMHGPQEQLFAGLSLTALAEALQATPEEVVAALPADAHHMVLALVETALSAGDADVRDASSARASCLPPSAPWPSYRSLKKHASPLIQTWPHTS